MHWLPTWVSLRLDMGFLRQKEGGRDGAVKSGGLGSVLRDLPGPPVPENTTHTLGFKGLPDSFGWMGNVNCWICTSDS